MKFSALRLLLFATLTLSASLATFADTLIGEAVAVTDGDTIVVHERPKKSGGAMRLALDPRTEH
jgi:hypothetical protein